MADDSPVSSGAELTLRNSPTGGAPGEHSPYYRRLLSAGYKGFLQGVIGGATLYALLGAIVGALVATPIWLGVLGAAGATIVPMAWSLIPIMAGIGLLKGASTFGNIGSVAAISAEGAEMSEERRYLLDRYYDLPLDHAYDNEAREIEKLLIKQHEVRTPKHMFHWKTLVVGALLGAAIGFGLVTFAAPLLAHLTAFLPAIEGFHLVNFAATTGPVLTDLGTAVAPAICAAIGGVAGAFVGLDRFYVRRWLDMAENLMTDPEQIKESRREKAKDVEKLIQASPTGGAETSAHRRSSHRRELPPVHKPVEPAPPVVFTNRPSSRISNAQLESRLAEINTAMSRPTV